jgi:diguanylate cyclase (GGDEF)-like protein
MRDQKPLSVLICDIDEFKQYNDNYGHIQGDECLKVIAKAIQDQFHRVGDVVARYGGEEFAIILPNADKNNARKLATALCKAVSSQKIPHEYASNTNHVTLSVGVATTDFDTGCNKIDLIAAADSALYHAKSQGRNCIRSAALKVNPNHI